MAEDKLIQFKGTIYENGYGLIAKKVMKDPNLSISAKAIYSYLCSYAGNEKSAFPSVKLIKYELGISKDTFYKYMRELTNKSYITITQNRAKGKFGHNVYSIEAIPCPRLSDTVLRDTVSSDTRNLATTINNTTNNNIINNKSSSKQADNKEVYVHYEQCGFGLLNKTIIDLIDADIELYGKQWVVEAMTESVRQGKCRLAFTEGILRNWKTNGKKVKSKVKEDKGNGINKEPNKSRVDESGIGFHF